VTLQAYELDSWVDAGAGDALPASGTTTVPVKHPHDFGPPTYRLVIVDSGGAELDARTLSIPYSAPSTGAAGGAAATTTDEYGNIIAGGAGAASAGAGPAVVTDSGDPEITSFTADETSLDADALARGEGRLVVAWEVANRTPTSNLVFEQVLADGLVASVELPRAHLWVPSSGQGPVAPVLPAAGESLVLRLQLVDLADDSLLDEKTLSLDIDTLILATIDSFTASPAAVSSTELAQGSARLTVAWSVSNRPPDTNLVFEQVLPDGSIVSIELPREDPIIPSSGQGPVAPVLPAGGVSSITLRLQLVDLTSDAVIDERTTTVQVVYPTPTPFVVNTPVPTSLPGQQLEITRFNVTPLSVERGGTVAVSWQVQGASVITIRVVDAVDNNIHTATDLPAAGSWSFDIPENYDQATVWLIATGAAGEQTTASDTVSVVCSYSYFFQPGPTVCPVGPASEIPAAFQAFEGGYMLWRGDTREIWVLANAGWVQRYTDTWVEGETIDIEDPPSGRYAPERGFGKVWVENPVVRRTLGWALALEQGYTMTMQLSSAVNGLQYTFFTWPVDSRVLQIVGNEWNWRTP
jgi:hypothetical protein